MPKKSRSEIASDNIRLAIAVEHELGRRPQVASAPSETITSRSQLVQRLLRGERLV